MLIILLFILLSRVPTVKLEPKENADKLDQRASEDQLDLQDQLVPQANG